MIKQFRSLLPTFQVDPKPRLANTVQVHHFLGIRNVTPHCISRVFTEYLSESVVLIDRARSDSVRAPQCGHGIPFSSRYSSVNRLHTLASTLLDPPRSLPVVLNHTPQLPLPTPSLHSKPPSDPGFNRLDQLEWGQLYRCELSLTTLIHTDS